MNAHPTFFQSTEQDVFDIIESIVTKRANPAVHRMTFANLMQHDNETVQQFISRLRAAAIDCNFSCPSCSSDIADTNIKDQFIRGLSNTVLQTDILAKATQLKTVEQIVSHAEAFESALRDQSTLSNSSNTFAARMSDHRRRAGSSNKFCKGCGSTSHGVSGTPARYLNCPAWGKKCSKCHIHNHDANVCNRRVHEANSLVAHVYQVCVSVDEERASVTPDTSRTRTKTVSVFPDSGANICLTGPKHLRAMGATISDLRPCHKKIRAVGGSILISKGWLPVKFDIDGNVTTQPVYICDNVDKFFFSKQGCIATNILPPCYPQPMEPSVHSPANSAFHVTATEELPTGHSPANLASHVSSV